MHTNRLLVALIGLTGLLAAPPALAQVSQVQNAGTALPRQRALNCTGSLTCSNDASGGRSTLKVGGPGDGLAVKQLATPGAPTVTTVGTAGGTSYTYYVVAKDKAGNTSLASSGTTINTGNATLNGTNFNHLTWTAVTGAATYDVLKADTAHSVATGLTTNSFDDKGGASSGYTAPVRNTSGDLSVDGVLAFQVGSAIASAATITPTSRMFHVTGAAAIATINAPSSFANGYGGCLYIIPDGAFTTTNAGNIAIASTAVVSKTLIECYDPGTSKYYPSY